MSIIRFPAAVLAAGVYLVCACDPAFAQAQRFRTYQGTAKVDTSHVAALQASRNVQVVVVMSEDSIATARARSATHSISLSERANIEQRVAAQHESIRPAIEAHGGKVLTKFHSALNGVKINIHPSEIAALAALPGVVKVLPVGRFHVNNVVSVPYIGAPAVWSGDHHFRGDHINQLDASLLKNLSIREPVRVQLRAELINVFNAVQFNTPSLSPTSANFARITASSQLSRPRTAQFGIRITY